MPMNSRLGVLLAFSALASTVAQAQVQAPDRIQEKTLRTVVDGEGVGDPVLTPEFEPDYDLFVLGSATGVPPQYGGVFILPSQPDTLYIGGAANGQLGALYTIGLVRDGQARITGFSGEAVRVADAPFIDGGIVRDPGGLISYAQWPQNRYAQIDLQTGAVVNSIDLAAFGVASASASVAFIPPGFPGAGGMRLSSWSGGDFYSIDYTVGPDGLIAIDAVAAVPGSTLPGGPEGWAYVPLDSPQFPQPSMIVSEYSSGSVAVYDMDASGNPVVASRRLFISGLDGAEGAAIDPISGAFIFSTFGGGDRVVVVNGFGVPPQGSLTPASFDYGTLEIGESSAAQPFTLSNSGVVDLDIAAVTAGGDYYAVIATDCPTGGTLAAGADCSIQVTCTPTAVGPQAGTLTAATAAGDLISELQCAGAPLPSAALTPASFDYGALDIGEPSPAQPFALDNTGEVPLAVDALIVVGDFYAITASDCPEGGPLAAGASCTIQVACTPTADGMQEGTLTAATGAGNLTSDLQCTGVPEPSAVLTPASFDFGTLVIGETGPAQLFALTNTGAVALPVVDIVVDGGFYALAASDCPRGGSLPAGASCALEVTCTPSAAGAQAGSLIADTDAGVLTSTLQCAGAPVVPPGPATPVSVNDRWALLVLVLGVLALVAAAGRRATDR